MEEKQRYSKEIEEKDKKLEQVRSSNKACSKRVKDITAELNICKKITERGPEDKGMALDSKDSECVNKPESDTGRGKLNEAIKGRAEKEAEGEDKDINETRAERRERRRKELEKNKAV